MKKKKRWVIDADVSKDFDSIPHRELRAFLDLRIKDGVLRRRINKWLRAGVLEEGVRHTSEAGTPQGGVLSPLLSNRFLHYVLDRWVEQTVQPRLRGRCQLVRYADDFVLLFEHQRDCERVLAVLGKRLARFGLRLHAEKTRSVDVRAKLPPDPGAGATFDFLGFTHVWVRSRWKYAVLRQHTAKQGDPMLVAMMRSESRSRRGSTRSSLRLCDVRTSAARWRRGSRREGSVSADPGRARGRAGWVARLGYVRFRSGCERSQPGLVTACRTCLRWSA